MSLLICGIAKLVNRLAQELHYKAKTYKMFKKGDIKNFLDYQIEYCENNDGIVLCKQKNSQRELYEYHLGNYSSLEHAEKAAIIYFMLARPSIFSTNIFYRLIGHGGCMSEWSTFKSVCEKEGIEIPKEITPIDGINAIIGYKCKPIEGKL